MQVAAIQVAMFRSNGVDMALAVSAETIAQRGRKQTASSQTASSPARTPSVLLAADAPRTTAKPFTIAEIARP
jgi:hypothetical protein